MKSNLLIRLFCTCLLLGIFLNSSGIYANSESLYLKELKTETNEGDPPNPSSNIDYHQ
jgi:hypothetical protein